jgi:hypothetical protein
VQFIEVATKINDKALKPNSPKNLAVNGVSEYGQRM